MKKLIFILALLVSKNTFASAASCDAFIFPVFAYNNQKSLNLIVEQVTAGLQSQGFSTEQLPKSNQEFAELKALNQWMNNLGTIEIQNDKLSEVFIKSRLFIEFKSECDKEYGFPVKCARAKLTFRFFDRAFPGVVKTYQRTTENSSWLYGTSNSEFKAITHEFVQQLPDCNAP